MSSSLGDRLRTARQAADLSLERVGKHVGVSAQAVQQWETGRNQPPVSAVLTIAQLTNVDLVWLITGKGVDPSRQRSGIVRAARMIPRLDLDAFVRSKSMDRRGALRGEDMSVVLSDVSAEAFWIEIEDERNAPEYRVGDRVILDPQEKPGPGDMVLAYLPSTNDVVLGEYSITDVSREGRTLRISSLNPAWGSFTIGPKDKIEILGKMVEHVRVRPTRRH